VFKNFSWRCMLSNQKQNILTHPLVTSHSSFSPVWVCLISQVHHAWVYLHHFFWTNICIIFNPKEIKTNEHIAHTLLNRPTDDLTFPVCPIYGWILRLYLNYFLWRFGVGLFIFVHNLDWLNWIYILFNIDIFLSFSL
jgi:hypothetical protein